MTEDLTGGLGHGGGSDEEAIWRDLVARFDEPVNADSEAGEGPVPWPEQENLAPTPRPVQARTLPPAETVTSKPREKPGPVAEDEDHFIPPPPPPLPKIDSVTKGAWAALFGGPAYLLVATAAGWTVPGIAAFCAVAAFVGGFAVLVLRMDDGPPRDSGPDDGAVV